jgi:uncharacterized coiled-coil protein SlyX
MSMNQILEQVRTFLYENEFKSLSDNFVKLRDELTSLQASLDTLNARLEKVETSKNASNVVVTVVPETTEPSSEETTDAQ